MLVPLFLAACLQTAPVALASTTADTSLTLDPLVEDEAWIRRTEGPPGASLYLSSASFRTLHGDLDGDGVFEAPSDVDALAWFPRGGGQGPGPQDFLFSSLTNSPAYLDGDFLRLDPQGGVLVEVRETDLIQLLQPASGGFDVDALAFRPPEEFWFSLEGDLKGTVLGDLQDGDVLVYDRAAGTIRREFTEAQIQAFVDSALGQSGPIGDLRSLSFYPLTGELVFTVQSPSSQDASAFGTAGGGRLLPGWGESDWNFQQSTELDALAFVPGGLPAPPLLESSALSVAPGNVVFLDVRHGTPQLPVEGFLALHSMFLDQPGLGAGFFFLDRRDRIFQRLVRAGRTHRQFLDANGNLSFAFRAPLLKPSLAHLDLYFQVRELGGNGWSQPLVVRVE